MNELHSHGAFADPRSYPLYGAVAHIARGKDTRNIGFEQEGVAIEIPPFGPLAAMHQVGASQQEPAFVALDDTCQPIRPRQRSYEDEHGTRRDTLYFIRARTQEGNFFETLLTMRLGHAGVRP